MNDVLSFKDAHAKKTTRRAWSAFFAHLASAQAATADECRWLAQDLENEGRFDLADHYRIFESEERAHATAMRSLCKDWRDPKVARVYKSKIVGRSRDSVEKMAILHFSLDTSFLTVLGTIHRNADELFAIDEEWAEEVRSRLAPIVRDEVFHLNEGQEMTIELARTKPVEARQRLKKKLVQHQKLVTKAVRRLLDETHVPVKCLDEINEAYQLRFERSIHSIN